MESQIPHFRITAGRLHTPRDINTLEERDQDNDGACEHTFIFQFRTLLKLKGGACNNHTGMAG